MKRGMFVVFAVLGSWIITSAGVAQDEPNPPTAPVLNEPAVSPAAVKQPETVVPAAAVAEAAVVPAAESKPAEAMADLTEAAKPAEVAAVAEPAVVPAAAVAEAAVVPAAESKPAEAMAVLTEAAKPAEVAAVAEPAVVPAAVAEAAVVPAAESKPAEAMAALTEAAKPVADPVAPVAKPAVAGASKVSPLEELKAAEESLGNPAQIKAGAAIAQQEKVRREASTIEGRKLLDAADNAYQAENYMHASQLYRDALGKLPVSKENRGLRTRATERAAEAVYEQARLLYKQGKLPEALELSQQALTVTPDSKPLRKLMTRIQDGQQVRGGGVTPPGTVNTPAKIAAPPQGRVNELMQTAASFLAVRDYAQAKVALESVLALEPGNREAIRILKDVNERRYAKNTLERNAIVAGMSADVRAKWNPPVYKIVEPPKQVEHARIVNSQPILDKMRKIIIPEIEFRQANVHDVVDFLNKASREGDKETTDPTQKGVNIILNLNPGQAGASAAPAAAAADPFAPAAGGAAAGGGGRNAYEITFQARYINLVEALKIITSVSGLKYLVDGNVVMIVPSDYDPAEIVTRMYPVEPDFVGRVKDAAAAAPARANAGGREIERIDNVDMKSAIPDLRDYFEKMGVLFPKAASITYNQAIGKLIVANTTQNLIKFEEILDGLNKALQKIQQIEIEARFVEVNETDLMELGLEWLLNSSWQILQNKNSGTLLGGRQRIQIDANSGSGGFTKGLNFWGTDAAQGGGVVAKAGGAGALGGLLSVSSILTNPELGVIVHALEQNGNADLLSAPKVTSRVGTEASIRVVTEYIYPTEFTMTTPPQAASTTIGGAASLPQPLVAIPANFVTREVGVILQVMPELSADGNVINLTMTPQVIREPTWYQYGATIPDGLGGSYQVNMPQPFFHTRSITTQISIYDGATVVMGGLIVEVVEKYNDQIPLLGDIPLLGALFRSKGEHSAKRNLLIFVTANVVDPAGRATRDRAVQGEAVSSVPVAVAPVIPVTVAP